MELRLYWNIIKTRLWIVVALVIICLLSFLLFAPTVATSYVANMRFVVGLVPEPSPETHYAYDRYYTWLTAEYLLDDLAEVVKSGVFAEDVAALAGVDLTPRAIQGITSAGKLHRVLEVSVNWHDHDQLARVANAVVQVLTNHGDSYFAQLSTNSAVISVIDPPTISPVGPSLRQRLDLPIRMVLALLAGIGLTFLLDYLDDTIRDRADLEGLGLPILAEIPARRRWPARFWRRRSLP